MKKILFVDDSEIQRKLISRILTKEKVEHVSCETVSDFISEAENKKYSAYIIDLNIEKPGDGQLIIQTLRKVGDQTPIIVASSSIEDSAIKKAINNGANDYICKPIDRSLLISKISNIVDSVERRVTLPVFRIPNIPGNDCQVRFKTRVRSISERELILKSRTYFYKNSKVSIDSKFFDLIGIERDLIELKVDRCVKIKDSNEYLTVLSFPLDDELLSKIRFYLSSVE